MTDPPRPSRSPWIPGLWKGLWVLALLAASATVRELSTGQPLWRGLLSALVSVGCFLGGWLAWRHEQRLIDDQLHRGRPRRDVPAPPPPPPALASRTSPSRPTSTRSRRRGRAR